MEHVQLSQLPHTTTGNHEEKIVLNIMGKPWILMNGSINEQFGEKHVVIHVEYTAKHDDVTIFLYIYIHIKIGPMLGTLWPTHGSVGWLSLLALLQRDPGSHGFSPGFETSMGMNTLGIAITMG